ncbi:hypothetical protein [Roseomonas sp. BN140053]|uniref:hypothetical protein n=1 Tax=Roseomonas sp. BN140053 TaxID=3391898 RepID=UPI0039EA9843
MRYALLALPLLAAACAAPGPTLDQRLATFVGRPEAELVAELGVPVRTYETGGRKFLEFQNQRTVAVAGDPLIGGFYGTGFYGGGFYGPRGIGLGYGSFGTSYVAVGCNVTFALRDARVESFTFRGQGCA